MKRFLALVTALCAGSLSAALDMYSTVGVGIVIPTCNSSFTSNSSTFPYSPTVPGDSLFQLPDVHWQNHYRYGIDASVAVGKKFSRRIRSDVEFLYQNIRRKIDGSYGWREVDDSTGVTFSENFQNASTPMTSRLSVYSLLLNGYYDFNNISNWTPALGVGIGFAVTSSPGTVAANTLVVNDPSIPLNTRSPMAQFSPGIHRTVFAAQLKAALEYAWIKNTYVVFQYRLFATSKLKAGPSKILSNPGTTSEGAFYNAAQTIAGLVTNSFEVLLRFNI